MNIRKILPLALLSALLFSVSCSNDSDFDNGNMIPSTYESGILIANEGGYSTPTADVSFVSDNLTYEFNKIYTNNNKEELGKVLQSIGIYGDRAYLVSNIPNKIDIVNRFTFKKQATVTTNLDNARYIAFSNDKYYVTNNNFTTIPSVRKLNVYNISDNSFVTSIDFPRYAEKVVQAEGNIIVQTDGVAYPAPTYNPVPTGYTVTVVKPSTNVVAQTIILPSNGMIKDLIAYKGIAYVLASDDTNSYIYKINSVAGTYTTTTLTGIPKVKKLRADNDKFYFITDANKVYGMAVGSTTIPTTPIVTAGGDAIDGRIFASEASFTSDSKVNVYNATSGALIKNFTTGVGTNGFYKN